MSNPNPINIYNLDTRYITPAGVDAKISNQASQVNSQSSIFRAMRSRLTTGIDNFYVGIIGDSTSSGTQKFAQRAFTTFLGDYPAYDLLWRDEDPATGLYGGSSAQSVYGNKQVLQRGTAGDAYVTFSATAGSHIDCPDRALFAITNLDVRVLVDLTTWTPATQFIFASKFSSAPNRDWYVTLETNGKMGLAWTSDGSTQNFYTSSLAVSGASGTPQWLRYTLQASTGILKFYTAPVPAVGSSPVWTQIGSNVGPASATSIYHSTQGIVLNGRGTPAITGKFYEFEMLHDIDGYPVASCDISERDPVFNEAQFVANGSYIYRIRDQVGNTWTFSNSVGNITGAPAVTVLNGSISGASIATHMSYGPLASTGIQFGTPKIGSIRPYSELPRELAFVIVNTAHNDGYTGFLSNPPSSTGVTITADVTLPIAGGNISMSSSGVISSPYGSILLGGVPIFYSGVSGTSLTGCTSYGTTSKTITSGTAIYTATAGLKELLDTITSVQPTVGIGIVVQNPQFNPRPNYAINSQRVKTGQVAQIAAKYNATLIDLMSLFTPSNTEALMSTPIGSTTADVSGPVSGATIPISTTSGLAYSTSRTVTDASVSGPYVTSATANFTTGDVGKVISGNGIGAGITILSFVSSTQVQLSANALGSGTNVSVTIGGGQAFLGLYAVSYTGITGTTLTGASVSDSVLIPSGTAVELRDGVHPSASVGMVTEANYLLGLMRQG